MDTLDKLPRSLIPGTELRPSVICLGTAQIGSGISRDDSFRVLDAFVERGGTFLDSAHIYADWLGGEKALSEKTIGAWMRSRGNRGDLVVATKGGHPELKSMRLRLAPEEISTDLSESLDCLGVERIDLYWLHRDDPSRPVAEILGVLEEKRRSGLILSYGFSNWTAPRLEEAVGQAAAMGVRGCVAVQNMWSLAAPVAEAMADRTIVCTGEAELAFHRRTGLAAVPFSSQAGGVFTKMERGIEPRPVYRSEENRRRFQRALEVAARHGRSVNDVALAYLLCRDFPVFPIVGCRTPEQLGASLQAATLRLHADEIAYLETGLSRAGAPGPQG